MNDRGLPSEAFSQMTEGTNQFEIEIAGEDVQRQDAATLLCFSHLRWEFVFQRPQHLMTRFARLQPVVYWEEPIDAADGEPASLHVRPARGYDGVTLVTPKLPRRLSPAQRDGHLRRLLDMFLEARPGAIRRWYYTPMMLPFSRHIEAEATIYDCMDELSAFRFAPAELLDLEQELLTLADVVFTGGYSLFEAKRDRHDNVHPFPSAVDPVHFQAARGGDRSPADQAGIARPRLGFYGVIDERFDLDLLATAAQMRPEWQFVMVGPVVKIDDADLPRHANIHYLGGKSYDELPAYLSGWDVALMPFAINESTRFISPTKTPEYLCAGLPVVSTRIRDVERHYAELQGVAIVDSAAEFVAACERMLALGTSGEWRDEADLHLAPLSWDTNQARMAALIDECVDAEPAIADAVAAKGRAETCMTI